jgi:hypothetical protein
LEHAEALVVASINDLTERHNFGAMSTARSKLSIVLPQG